MTSKRSVLGIIPARGGSKGVPKKNVRQLGGKPLIAWTIDAAISSGCFDRVVVSTDCENIADISKKYGAEVPFFRPKYLSSDEAKTADVVSHVLESLGQRFDFVAVLQPTSPFRTAEHIVSAFDVMWKAGSNSLVSLCEAKKSPFLMYTLKQSGGLTPIIESEYRLLRRQEQPKTFCLNGAIYIVQTELFLNEEQFFYHYSKAFIMDEISSIDIDNEIDFRFAQYIVDQEKYI